MTTSKDSHSCRGSSSFPSWVWSCPLWVWSCLVPFKCCTTFVYVLSVQDTFAKLIDVYHFCCIYNYTIRSSEGCQSKISADMTCYLRNNALFLLCGFFVCLFFVGFFANFRVLTKENGITIFHMAWPIRLFGRKYLSRQQIEFLLHFQDT